MRDFWGRKTVCLVTGASQNIGRAFAESVAPKLGADSLLILTSRTSDKLGVIRQSIYEVHHHLRIELLEWDLTHPNGEQYKEDLVDILKRSQLQADEYELAMIVHNARTSDGGDTQKQVIDLIDAAYIQEHLNINLVSMLVSNSAFWSVFGRSREKVLINMTSLPENLYGLDSISKASRTIALNILANECPEIKVLHYSPGTVDTSMLQTIIKSARDRNATTRKMQELFEQSKILKPKQTVDALLNFLAAEEIDPCMELDAQQLLARKH